MNTMTYQGYTAYVRYSEADNCFVGDIIGIHDVVSFEGESVTELRTAFEQAVDDYLQTCKALAREPNRPYSGQFRLRIPATLHAQAVVCAKSQDKSLNAWITDAIKQRVQDNV